MEWEFGLIRIGKNPDPGGPPDFFLPPHRSEDSRPVRPVFRSPRSPAGCARSEDDHDPGSGGIGRGERGSHGQRVAPDVFDRFDERPVAEDGIRAEDTVVPALLPFIGTGWNEHRPPCPLQSGATPAKAHRAS